MPNLVDYRLEAGIATITLDDGKLNVLSPAMIAELGGALDRAQGDRAAVLLTGREGVFSAGFDLRVLSGPAAEAQKMFLDGFRLAERILSHPAPVVIACPGHAIAMGAFLVLSADFRIGVGGPYKIGANEVAIGLVMPFFGIEICRQRLAPAHFHRAVINAEIYRPEEAVGAGFLDRVVAVAELPEAARATATALARLDVQVHTATKLRARRQAIAAIRSAMEADEAMFQGREPGRS